MKKLILLFVITSSLVKAQCNASTFSPVTVCPYYATLNISQNMQTDIIYICGQNAIVYDTLDPSSIKYRQVFINSGGKYYFKSTITNNQVTVYAKNGSFCTILSGSNTGPMFTFNQEPTATLTNVSSNTVTINGCSSISNPTTSINCTATGINQSASENSLVVWPNPSKGKVFLALPPGLTGNIKITDQLGNVLLNKEVNSEFSGELSLESFSDGIYYLRLNSGDNSFSTKLVLTK